MKKRLNEMKAMLEERVKAQPRNAETWRELAQVKMMLGDIEGAENDCIECLHINSMDAAGLVLMGNLQTRKNNDKSAEDYYIRAIAADPNNVTAHSNYGTILLKRGEKFKALGELRRSVEIDNKQCIAQYMLAQCYLSMEDWHSAWLVARDALNRGEVGFEDSQNFTRIRDGLVKIRDFAAARGGAESPRREEKAMEQSLRQSTFDRKHEKSDPGVNMMMAMYMLGAMQRFDKLSAQEVQAIANEIAILGTHGISTANDAKYTLNTIPGENFSGYRLLANYYVSWARAYPDHLAKIGLPFDDAYALARQMYTPPKKNGDNSTETTVGGGVNYKIYRFAA